VTNHVNQREAIRSLLEAVETTADRKMQTPKDFNFLADAIFRKLHKSVSPTTLKRLWGYLSEPVIPRVSTLDIIAQYVGSDSWESYCQQLEEGEATGVDAIERPPTSIGKDRQQSSQQDDSALYSSFESHEKPFQNDYNTPHHSFSTIGWIILVVLVMALLFFSWFFYQQSHSAGQDDFILKKGQLFKKHIDYLNLFGIKDTAFYWGRPIPHHHNISVWGPEYQHPHWHNYGNPDEMMPTITERWEPEGVDSNLVVMRNYDNYCHEVRINEVRLTFMKNLVDTGYVFLGVYRMRLAESDTTHCVWERVADECDLRNLDYLESFRNNNVFPSK